MSDRRQLHDAAHAQRWRLMANPIGRALLLRRRFFVRSMSQLGHALLVSSLVWSAAPATAAAQAPTVPAGTLMSVRVLDTLSSQHSAPGARVRAMVLVAVVENTDSGRVLIAPRTMLEGVVEDVGTEHARSARHFVQLHFTALVLDDGTRVPLSARVTDVDNAREIVDSAGRILGPPHRSLLRARSDWAFAALGTVDPVAAAILFSTVRGESDELHRRVQFMPGTDMTVRLDNASTLPGWPSYRPPRAVPDLAALDALLASLPVRGTAMGGRIEADFMNVILVGSQEQVRAAFAAAQWDVPDRMSTRSDFDTFIEAAKAQGYDHQPVSQILLFGRAPDLVFQRVTDTFAKRHHVRLWKSEVLWQEQPVWVGAAAHDIGVEVSRERRGFSHRIDPSIDGERDKVVTDLVAARQVAAQAWIERRPPPDSVSRAELRSDWRVAFLHLTPR